MPFFTLPKLRLCPPFFLRRKLFFFFFFKDSYVWKQDTKISLKETRIINNLILFIACGALMSDSDINKMCLNSDLFDTICSIELCTCPNLNLPHNERWHKTVYVQSICVFLNSNLCAKQIRMEGYLYDYTQFMCLNSDLR